MSTVFQNTIRTALSDVPLELCDIVEQYSTTTPDDIIRYAITDTRNHKPGDIWVDVHVEIDDKILDYLNENEDAFVVYLGENESHYFYLYTHKTIIPDDDTNNMILDILRTHYVDYNLVKVIAMKARFDRGNYTKTNIIHAHSIRKYLFVLVFFLIAKRSSHLCIFFFRNTAQIASQVISTSLNMNVIFPNFSLHVHLLIPNTSTHHVV